MKRSKFSEEQVVYASRQVEKRAPRWATSADNSVSAKPAPQKSLSPDKSTAMSLPRDV